MYQAVEIRRKQTSTTHMRERSSIVLINCTNASSFLFFDSARAIFLLFIIIFVYNLHHRIYINTVRRSEAVRKYFFRSSLPNDIVQASSMTLLTMY